MKYYNTYQRRTQDFADMYAHFVSFECVLNIALPVG